MLKLAEVQNAQTTGLITELEAKVLDYVLIEYVDSDGMCSEFMRASKDLGIPFPQLKGVVGSLAKKNLVVTEDYTSGKKTNQWIHATDKGLEIVGLTWDDFRL